MIIVRVKRSATTWETFTAASEDEAISKIREQYPKAVNYPWGIDRDGAAPGGQVMYVYDAQESSGHSSQLVARMRRES
jgi:hypothetical protein